MVVFGTDEQRGRWLEPLIAGREKACFAVTEPDAGLDTTKLGTRAVRQGDNTSCMAARSGFPLPRSPTRSCCLRAPRRCPRWKKPTQGLSLFYTDLDRERIEVREIDKLGRKCVDTNQLFIDGLRIPVADRIGEGRGFSTSCTA